VRIMNTQGISSWLVSGLAVLTLMISLFALDNPVVQLAAQSSNMTGSPLLPSNGSQSTQPASQIPSTALQSILEQTQGANATSFAIGNIINQTGLSNTTQVGPDNETMNSVIEEARNTNATSFATGNIINQTQQSGNSTIG
jgi:hypothetical protein